MKKNIRTLLVASKVAGLEENSEKPWYVCNISLGIFVSELEDADY